MAKSLRNGGFSRFEQNYRLEGGLLVDFTHIVPSVRFGSLADVRKKRATESLRGLARLARGKAWGRFGQSYGRRGFRPWGDPSASRSADLPSCKRTFWQVMGQLLLQVICQLSFKSLNRRATTSNSPVGLCKKTSATSAYRHGAPLRGDGFI